MARIAARLGRLMAGRAGPRSQAEVERFFRGLRLVIPQPVHNTVDGWWTDPVTRGKTAVAQWIACGRRKNLQIAADGPLCAQVTGQ
jgi:hypothetical protein